MSYETIEAKALTLIQGLTRFSGHINRVTRGDFSVLDLGVPEAVVIRPGEMAQQSPRQTLRGPLPDRERTWTINIMVLAAYGANRVASPALVSLRDAVIDLFDQNPTMGLAGVKVLEINAAPDLFETYDKAGNGPFFLAQTLTLTVHQLYKVTGGEY